MLRKYWLNNCMVLVRIILDWPVKNSLMFCMIACKSVFEVRTECFEWVTPTNISSLFKQIFKVDMTSRLEITLNQHWKNVVCFSVGIYNVDQRLANSGTSTFQLTCLPFTVQVTILKSNVYYFTQGLLFICNRCGL